MVWVFGKVVEENWTKIDKNELWGASFIDKMPIVFDREVNKLKNKLKGLTRLKRAYLGQRLELTKPRQLNYFIFVFLKRKMSTDAYTF